MNTIMKYECMNEDEYVYMNMINDWVENGNGNENAQDEVENELKNEDMYDCMGLIVMIMIMYLWWIIEQVNDMWWDVKWNIMVLYDNKRWTVKMVTLVF